MTDEERELLELEILRKSSPMALPNNPAASGWTPNQIKAKYYEGLAYLYGLFKGVRAETEEVNEKADQINERTEQMLDVVATMAYVDSAVNNAVANTMKAMGSVSSVSNLPENASVGDTYNVASTGDDYQWTGTEWNKLAGDINAGEGVSVNGNTISSLTTATDVVINIKD